MVPSISICPRTLLNDCKHSATATFWRSTIPNLDRHALLSAPDNCTSSPGHMRRTRSQAAAARHKGETPPATWLPRTSADSREYNASGVVLRKPTIEGLSGVGGVATTVTVANGQTLPPPGRGSVSLSTSVGDRVMLTNTLLVPGILTNLFSVRAADRNWADIRFDDSTASIKKESVVVAVGHVNMNEQYEMKLAHTATPGEVPAPHAALAACGNGNARGNLWRLLFSHLG